MGRERGCYRWKEVVIDGKIEVIGKNMLGKLWISIREH